MGRAAQVVDPSAAQREARHILGDRRFHSNPAPRPLRGPLEWLGDKLHPVAKWIGDVLGHVPKLVWLALAVLAVGSVIARIIVVSQRRRVAPGASGRGPSARHEEPEDPAALERAADEAERDGDLERAVRLRFRAGLLRLGDRGAIRYRPSVTTSEVRRALESEKFDELAGSFESITYGGKPAQKPDVEASRRDWPRVLDEAGRR